MELGVSILLIWYPSLLASKHVELLQSFCSPGSKMTTFLESQITNFRIIIIVWITIESVLSSVFIKYFIKYNVICYFLCCSLKVFWKALGKTFNILLFLAITTEAVVFTYSNQKIVILCSFGTFRSIFPSPVLNCKPLSNTLLAWFCKGDKNIKK